MLKEQCNTISLVLRKKSLDFIPPSLYIEEVLGKEVKRRMGYLLIFIGFLLCIPIIGIPIGLPLIIKGRHIISRNIIAKGVEQGIEEAKRKEQRL